MPVVAVLAALIMVAGIALQAWDTYREYQEASPGTVQTTSPAEPQPSPAGDEPTTPPADEPDGEKEEISFPHLIQNFRLIGTEPEVIYGESVVLAEYRGKLHATIYALAEPDRSAEDLLDLYQVSSQKEAEGITCGTEPTMGRRVCATERGGLGILAEAQLAESARDVLVPFTKDLAEAVG